MATNTAVLIFTAALAALLLAGMLAVGVCETRARHRPVNGETIRDRAEGNARQVRYQESLADVYTVNAHAAEVQVGIKTARAWRLQRQAAVHRSEAAARQNYCRRG